MYLDVADRAATDLTFVIKQLKEEMYSCLDRFDVVTNLQRNSVSGVLINNLENIRIWSKIHFFQYLKCILLNLYLPSSRTKSSIALLQKIELSISPSRYP